MVDELLGNRAPCRHTCPSFCRLLRGATPKVRLPELSGFIDRAASLLLPRRCLVCGRRLWHSEICARCTPLMFAAGPRCPICFSPQISMCNEPCLLCRLLPLPFGTIRYLWEYEHEARRFITTMKYRPSPRLCRIAGRLLAETFPVLKLTGGYELLVPIPSSEASLRRRGFNQCQLIAGETRRRVMRNLRFAPAALQHRGGSCPQASLPHRSRVSNVKRAFTAAPALVQDRHILLFDDVLTTGATSAAAALALLDAGAARIDLLALARSDTWNGARHTIYRMHKQHSLRE